MKVGNGQNIPEDNDALADSGIAGVAGDPNLRSVVFRTQALQYYLRVNRNQGSPVRISRKFDTVGEFASTAESSAKRDI